MVSGRGLTFICNKMRNRVLVTHIHTDTAARIIELVVERLVRIKSVVQTIKKEQGNCKWKNNMRN